MPTATQVERWKRDRLQDWRGRVKDHPQVLSLSVTCKLLDKGDTLDDVETQRRWTFNRHGELIATRHVKNVEVASNHPWRPDTLHSMVNIA